MKLIAILILLFGSVQAYATRQHCEPKPREPVSKPEPKAPDRVQRDRSDHDRPCDRTIGAPVWCRVLK
jgi:hypothetical protein